jgi:hypothetical protein
MFARQTVLGAFFLNGDFSRDGYDEPPPGAQLEAPIARVRWNGKIEN